ncbi:hypothetical protein GCK32_020579 [Trichostrongylus colubriformis]|uniref:Uncharacterized protein n=1 Tax=Trichostrongylus colubriformis TaxID=6319 RepID=A0AAN8IG30_TRICO
MWMLLCIFIPAVLFCICALIAWLKVLQLNRKRQKRNKPPDEAKNLEQGTVCNIPIRVLDVDTGKTFIYSSNEEIRPEC